MMDMAGPPGQDMAPVTLCPLCQWPVNLQLANMCMVHPTGDCNVAHQELAHHHRRQVRLCGRTLRGIDMDTATVMGCPAISSR